MNRKFYFFIKTFPRLYTLHTTVLIGGVILCSPVWSEDYFDPNAIDLQDNSKSVDLSVFSQNEQLPGIYRVDIYLNGKLYDTSRDVMFVKQEKKLVPEITVAELDKIGVKIHDIAAFDRLNPDAVILDLNKIIPSADTNFDFSQQRLDISIPQAVLNLRPRDMVDPARWDQGLPALFTNYNLSGANTQQKNNDDKTTDNSIYLNLNSGLNIGPWRLRNYSTYTDNAGQYTATENTSSTKRERHWQNINTYLQRDIQFLRAQMVFGESATPGYIFDSVQFRGIQLASDDNMLPDSMRGFAPVVRGIARTNAQVTIRQNGYIIYQSYVAPGAFAIHDLYPTANSGNLDVTIREMDGSEHTFVQPFSAVSVMQREGQIKYAITGGEYRTLTKGASTPKFIQSYAAYGLTSSSTAYAGTQISDNYSSFLFGWGQGFGDYGSLSFDITQANTTLKDNSKHDGQSYRMQYAKDVFQSGTTFTLAGYRYSTEGFYDFKEANEIGLWDTNNQVYQYNKRSKIQIQINQSLDSFGSAYITAYQQDYWHQEGHERTFNAGYNLTLNNISYGLNYTNTKIKGHDSDQQIAFNVQIPLSKWLPNSWASYNVNTSKNGTTRNQVGIAGTMLADNNLSYSVQESYGNKGEGNGGNINADYKGSYGELRGGYNYNRNSQQKNYGVSGGIVVHPYGVTLSQPLGDTFALVRAPKAKDVSIQNQTGVATDWRGYTIVPYVSAYRENRIALNPETFNDDIDIDTATQSVVPTQGALVLADFNTRVGNRVLMTLHYKNGTVPFGAIVSLQSDKNLITGIVDEHGEVYLSGVSDKSVLKVTWGKNQCIANVTLPTQQTTKKIVIYKLTSTCQ